MPVWLLVPGGGKRALVVARAAAAVAPLAIAPLAALVATAARRAATHRT